MVFRAGMLGAVVLSAELCLLAYGCSDAPEAMPLEAGSVDAQADTMAPAKPRDAAASADAEADGDAGDPDFKLKGDWQPIPNLGTKSCLYATDPPKSVDPLTWEPCTGRPGCQRMKADWTTHKRGALVFSDLEPVVPVAGVPHIMTERHYPRVYGPHEMISVAEDLAGNVKFAMASYLGDVTVDSCFSLRPSISPTMVGLQALIALKGESEPGIMHLIWAPITTPSAINSASYDTAGVALSGDVQAGDQRLFVGNGPRAVFDTTSGLSIPRKPNYEAASSLRPVTGGVVGVSVTTQGIAFISNDNQTTSVYVPSSGHNVVNVVVDRSAGDRLVWVEYEGPGLASYWTGVFTGPQNQFVPTRITGYDGIVSRGGLDMAANAGLIVNYDRYDRALVTRISDGWSWTISPPDGEYFYRGVWADANEVWLAVAAPGPSGIPSNGLDPTSVARFTLVSLGAPTVPPQ